MDGSSGEGDDSDESDWTGIIFFFVFFSNTSFSFLSCFFTDVVLTA